MNIVKDTLIRKPTAYKRTISVQAVGRVGVYHGEVCNKSASYCSIEK